MWCDIYYTIVLPREIAKEFWLSIYIGKVPVQIHRKLTDRMNIKGVIVGIYKRPENYILCMSTQL